MSLKDGHRRSEESPVIPCFALIERALGRCCRSWFPGQVKVLLLGCGLSSALCWIFPFAFVTILNGVSWEAMQCSSSSALGGRKRNDYSESLESRVLLSPVLHWLQLLTAYQRRALEI